MRIKIFSKFFKKIQISRSKVHRLSSNSPKHFQQKTTKLNSTHRLGFIVSEVLPFAIRLSFVLDVLLLAALILETIVSKLINFNIVNLCKYHQLSVNNEIIYLNCVKNVN